MVRKSSPLGRKPRKKAAETSAPKAAAKAVEANVVDEAVVDEAVVEAEQSTSTVVESAEVAGDISSDDAVVVDDSGASASYRDRRTDAQRRRTAREAAAAAPRSTLDRGKTLRLVAMLLGAVVLIGGIVASTFFGIALSRTQDERALRAEYATFARQVVVQMTTLNADNADEMYKTAMEKTSGRAQQVFRDNMKQVTDLVRKGDAVTKTTVLVDAVSKAQPNEGTVLMVVGWESRSKDGKQEPMFQTFRYEVGITRINGDLKLTDLEFVW